MPTETTLPFSPFTNRILEDAKFTNMDVIKETPVNVIMNRIIKIGHFDASKARCCGQEIEEFFKKQENKIMEDTNAIRSNQYYSPTASETIGNRKKIIDELMGSNRYVVLDEKVLNNLQIKLSGTSKPLSDWATRDSIKAMGYYYTTSLGTGLKGAYISKSKDTKDIVRHRASKANLVKENTIPFEKVKALRDEWAARLNTKDYVILDDIQLNDIMERLSSSNKMSLGTFRNLMSDYNAQFYIIEDGKYYYASSKVKLSRGGRPRDFSEMINNELRKNPRVFGAFPDDIAKLLIHADIIYIKDFVDIDDNFLKELFKEVNYDEATIQKCLDAIHEYRNHLENNKLIVEEKKESLTDKEIDEIHDKVMNEIKSESQSEEANNTPSSIKIGDKITVTAEEFKQMLEPNIVKSDETETSEGIEVSHEQAEEEVENKGVTLSEFKNAINSIGLKPFVKEDKRPSIDDIPIDPKEIKFEDSDIYNPKIMLEKLRRIRLGNATAERCLGFKMHQEKPQDIPKESMNTSYGQQTQQQLIPKMINPSISGTCPYCNNSFTVPTTITHRVYCFACGNIMQY